MYRLLDYGAQGQVVYLQMQVDGLGELDLAATGERWYEKPKTK
jgi:hypothetical protein